MKTVAVIVVALSFLLAPSVKAEVSAAQMLQYADSSDTEVSGMARMAINQMSIGIHWAGVMAEKRGAELFCQPDKLSLTDKQLVEMLRDHVAEHPDYEDLPAGAVLLWSLMEVFPCEPHF